MKIVPFFLAYLRKNIILYNVTASLMFETGESGERCRRALKILSNITNFLTIQNFQSIKCIIIYGMYNNAK